MINREDHTFIGCDGQYADSRIVLFGAPFDSTASFRPGARFASAAIRNDSNQIETYSPYWDRDLSEIEVYDSGDLELPFGNTERTLKMIEEYTDYLLSDNKTPFMIGGEHLVTLGAVRAAVKGYSHLHILHFDAHTDMRDKYLGEKLSHATVIRRCHELVGDGRIFSFGIRSGDREEFRWAKNRIDIRRFNFDGLEMTCEYIGQNPLYLTIDLDVLDPGVFPGTGTPEAGGVSFKELMGAIKTIRDLKMNIIGLDINELCPPYDQSGISAALACKVVRELLLIV